MRAYQPSFFFQLSNRSCHSIRRARLENAGVQELVQFISQTAYAPESINSPRHVATMAEILQGDIYSRPLNPAMNTRGVCEGLTYP